MATATKRMESVAAYVAAQPAATRAILKRLRAAIRAAIPDAEECLSYQMPTYKLAGRAVIYFAAWKAHVAIYPASADVVRVLAEELDPGAYTVAKGTIRFPIDASVPVPPSQLARVVARMAKLRAASVAKPRQPKPKRPAKKTRPKKR